MNYKLLLLIGLFIFSLSLTACRRHKKPVLYLYPTEQMKVNVQIDVKGKLRHTYPKYNPQTGWNVIAQPNGDIKDNKTGKDYYSLYWEAQTHIPADWNKGFVVSKEETATFLEEKLANLGLNRREANEFIVYWLPLLERNPYNLIHFATDNYTDRSNLQITPKPETLIRVCMLYKALKKPVDVEAQILQPMQRKGFTVVEWGGMQIGKDVN